LKAVTDSVDHLSDAPAFHQIASNAVLPSAASLGALC